VQNGFSTLALLLWPIVALWLYLTRPINQATMWTILGGMLLLPVGVDIKLAPGIPQLDKVSIPNIAALAGCMLVGKHVRRPGHGIGFAEVLLSMFLIGPFITSELNGDVLFIGGGNIIPAVGHYDALSAVVGQFIFILPFFLGRKFFASATDTIDIIRTLVTAGLIYSVPLLLEVRLSPQLHYWFYGFSPSDFVQGVRSGGYRPMAFMGHGLLAAFFVMTTVVAAAALWRTRTRILRFIPAIVTASLGAMLILCKSLGALTYGVALVPLVRLGPPRLQLGVASVLVTIAMAYPVLRIADAVPTDTMLEIAASASADRRQSLEFRFDQEAQLLAHDSERLLFGWGRFGRARVYDPEFGKDISVTDGHWIITMGQFGIFGFLAEFGLLALPVFRAASALRFTTSRSDAVYLAALALIVAINMIDLLPNSSIMPWTWLLAGALLGRTEALRAASASRRAAASVLMGNGARKRVSA